MGAYNVGAYNKPRQRIWDLKKHTPAGSLQPGGLQSGARLLGAYNLRAYNLGAYNKPHSMDLGSGQAHTCWELTICGSTIWDPTMWEPTTSPAQWNWGLDKHTLARSLQSGGLQSGRSLQYAPLHAFWIYINTHLLGASFWRRTFWEPTAWEPTISRVPRMWDLGRHALAGSLQSGRLH